MQQWQRGRSSKILYMFRTSFMDGPLVRRTGRSEDTERPEDRASAWESGKGISLSPSSYTNFITEWTNMQGRAIMSVCSRANTSQHRRYAAMTSFHGTPCAVGASKRTFSRSLTESAGAIIHVSKKRTSNTKRKERRSAH